MRSICFLILLFSSLKTKAQFVCKDSGITVRYTINKPSLNIRNQNACADNGILSTGYILYPALLSFNGFISKLNAKKEIEWSKEVSWGNSDSSIDLFSAKEYSDGSIIAAGISTNKITNNRRPLLYKFDATGNILWQKSIETYVPFLGEIEMLIDGLNEGSNGDILLSYHYQLSQQNSLLFSSVARINNNGDIVWQRDFSNSVYIPGNGTFFNNKTVISSLHVIGDSLFCFGEGPTALVIFKLGYTTGKPGSSRSSKYNPITSSTFVVSEKFHTTNVVKGNLFSCITETVYFTSQNEMFSVLFDTNLNVARQFRLTVPGINYSAMSGVRKNIFTTSSDTILLNMPVDAHNYFISLTSSGKILQERKMLNSFMNFGYYNNNLITGNSEALAVLLTTNQPSLPAGFELLQLQDYGSQFENCLGKTEPHIQVSTMPLITADYPLNNQVTNTIQTKALATSISDLSFTKQVLCKSISICDSVKIEGPNKACRLNEPLTFKVHRRTDCLKRIDWGIDTAAISSMQHINDSTISILFKKEWSGYLYASITTSCGLIIDSLLLSVSNSSSSINLGSDKTLCTDTGIVLHAGSGFTSYQWQDGSSDSVFRALLTGKYYVTATNKCGNAFTDTINVNISAKPTINLGKDSSFCENQLLILDAGNQFVSYLWNTGETTASIKVNAPGSYDIIATDINNCKAADTMIVYDIYPIPKPVLNKDPNLCQGQNDILDAGDFYQYLWNDGSTKRTITVTNRGKYKVIVTTRDGCINTDSVIIRELIASPAAFLMEDTTICKGATIELKPNRYFKDHLWSTGSITPTIQTNIPGRYQLRVTDHYGCIGKDTIDVTNRNCPGIFYMPNAFTPNGDTKNDVIKPIIDAVIINYSFTIYNRWGQMVFRSNEAGKGWDGKLKGIVQATGTYTWMCSYTLIDQPPAFYKGTFILLK